MRTLVTLVAFSCIASSGFAQKGSDYKYGQKIQGELTLGFDGTFSSTKRVFPLPQGEWTVLVGNDSQSTSSVDVANRNPIQFGNVSLVQHDSGRVGSLIYLSTTVSTRATNWNDKTCARTDPIHQNKYSSSVWVQRCLEVYHTVNFLVNPPAGLQSEVKSAITKMGLTVAPVVMNMFYTQLDQRGNFIRYQYIVDPAQFGLTAADSSLSDSPWHRDRLEREPARLQFAKQFVDYSEKVSTMLEGTFNQTPVQRPSFSGSAQMPRFEIQK